MKEHRGALEAAGHRFAIVASRFNAVATERLVAGARACLVQHGADDDSIELYWVPGAWELAIAADRVAATGRFAAVIAIGCVVRGDTPHFDYVCGSAATGLTDVSLRHSLPVAFGVLTTDTADQAMQRAGGKHGNKGWEAALAALETVNLLDRVEA